jgi:hypothetical protein
MITPRIIRNTSAATVAGIAAVASYAHMRELAVLHGQGELIASLVPISVDGMLVVATVAMHDDRISGRKVRPAAWVAFCTGVLASVTANVLAAPDDLISRIVSAWPAVALLLVIEVLATGGRKSADKAADTRTASSQASHPARADNRPDTTTTRRSSAPAKRTAPRRSAEQVRRAAAALDADGHDKTQIAGVLGVSERTVARALADPTTATPRGGDL